MSMSEKLFVNGRIFTSVEEDDTLYEAKGVREGKVFAVGRTASIRAQMKDVPEVDLAGKLVIPGLIDAHTHIGQMGQSMGRFDCLGKSIKEVQTIVAQHREAHPQARLLLGIVPDTPVFIDSADLHSCWLNSAALHAIGVDDSTPEPKGGSYERDDHGRLTGLVLETGLSDVIWPWLANQTSLDERIKYLRSAFEAYLATGVTGVVDMAMNIQDLDALEEYHRTYGLPFPVHCHWLISGVATPAQHAKDIYVAASHRERLQPLAPWLQVVGIKIISDGVVDTCTAYLKEPYYDGSLSDPIWPKDHLMEAVTLADSLDLQVAVHAIGDAASESALDSFEAAIKNNGERALRRHRIEHLEVVTRDSIDRIAKLGVTASLQPVHADPMYVPNWRLMLGNDERCDRAFPWSEYVESKAHIALGSDSPTAPHHTCPNLYTATTRRSGVDPTFPEPTDPRILLLDRFVFKLASAIRFYSAGSARSVRVEKERGELAPGKSADFAILSFDPFADGFDTLREAQQGIEETWIGGERAWSRDNMQ